MFSTKRSAVGGANTPTARVAAQRPTPAGVGVSPLNP